MSERAETSARGLLVTLVALLVLAAFSLAMRFAHLGTLGYLVAMGVAVIKAVLVAIFFMEILTEKASAHLAFAACLSLFALLLSLVVADVITRPVPPLLDPPGTGQRYRG
jgi:cytochrome c oxidase subunit 4